MYSPLTKWLIIEIFIIKKMISSNFDKKIIDRDVYLIPKNQMHTQTVIFMHGYGDSPDGYMDVFYVDNPPVPKGTNSFIMRSK